MMRPVVVVALATLCACDPASKESPSTSEDKADKAEASADKDADKGDAKPSAKGDKAKGDKKKLDPCTTLTEAKVRAAAEVAEGVEIKIEAGKFVKNVCEYQWRNDGEARLFSGKISIGVPRTTVTADNAATIYTRGLEELDKAMAVDGKPPESSEVAGVGEQAHWYPSMSQLSVQNGALVRHITISTSGPKDDAARLALAKKIAAVIE